ncbi:MULTISPECIES: MarR family winged helix-turn-helix transcriptional regulator [unclassified Curtobacterium]|uniref:MarR family winged helix-turn-helix transcriptional regulator n=1 Tax=unclassified Curtobacterium TaxID=257496 RepID=UPI0008DE5760|nr:MULTISPECIES: MarR family transcriptional regulator [unclassified Curtobacterium]OIH96481.1 transcriptional regulator [Curtobacterium sp. MCBA15_003]OII13846.1 transcriptional regulator [Curtobacterium sp. MCBA15_009]OII33678.1 transcriptional regulator [Curtobacterium sp. MMLR14_006]
MDERPDRPDLPQAARRLSAEIGPFRRTLLVTARRSVALPDIPDAQIEVLRRLDDAGWSSPTALGRALGLARSTVSNLVAAMERDGLVDRRLAQGDGRSTEVGLTDLARRRLADYDESAERVLVDAMTSLSADDQRALAAAVPALGRLRARLDEHSAG